MNYQKLELVCFNPGGSGGGSRVEPPLSPRRGAPRTHSPIQISKVFFHGNRSGILALQDSQVRLESRDFLVQLVSASSK